LQYLLATGENILPVIVARPVLNKKLNGNRAGAYPGARQISSVLVIFSGNIS